MIKQLDGKEVEQLKLFPTDFPFPDLSSGLYCSQKALYSPNGEFVGSALLKLTSEAILILDPKADELTRAAAIAEAFKQVPSELDRYGLDQTHVFVLPENDERYAQFLIRHFNFKRASGIPLVYTR